MEVAIVEECHYLIEDVGRGNQWWGRSAQPLPMLLSSSVVLIV
jgi:hypothetical protein